MKMRWPNDVVIKEVGPRDGLQNEKGWIETDDKIALIDKLTDSGIRNIEYSSFVHPKWIPQLSDAREVGRRIKRHPNVTYSALVPNEKGLEHALEAGIDTASVFMSASETHNKRNINKTIDETFPVLNNVIQTAKQEKKHVTGYVSTVFDCPFEGNIALDQVLYVCDRLFEQGVDDISLGDTIGTAVPSDVEELLEGVIQRYPNKNIIMHFHDTRGMAIANIITSMQYGITNFDASIGGLGGCPYAPGAAGNVATNDLMYLLEGLGVHTGVDKRRVLEASKFVQEKIGKTLPSRSLQCDEFAPASEFEPELETEQQTEDIWEKSGHTIKINPQRKREHIYFFIKNQYDKIRSKS